MNRNRIIKLAAVILTLVLIIGVFSACNRNSVEQANDEESKRTSAESSTSEKAEEPKKDVTLTIWHYLNDREAIMKGFAAQYEEKTGVKVDFQLYSGDQMKAKVQAAAQAKSLPEAWVFVGGKPDIAQYAKAGNILNLYDSMKDWKTRFNESILVPISFTEGDGYEVEAGIYGVPLDVNNMQFLYNKDLFKKAGLDPETPPKTWNEFIEFGKKLKSSGIIPFATGIGSWAHYALTEQYHFAYMDLDKIEESRKGNITYKEAGMENVLKMMVEMRDAGLFAEGVATMDLPTAEQMFANGQVAMIYDGSWAIGVFNSMNPDFKNYGVFFPPKDERAQHDVLIPGGIGAYFVVNKESQSAKECVDFLNWLTDKEQQVVYANGSFNLPANKDAVDPNKLLPQTAEFANDMDKLQPAVPPYKAGIADIYGAGIQMIIIGEKTPEEIVMEMDKNNK